MNNTTATTVLHEFAQQVNKDGKPGVLIVFNPQVAGSRPDTHFMDPVNIIALHDNLKRCIDALFEDPDVDETIKTEMRNRIAFNKFADRWCNHQKK
jgi:hypothetical protein